MTLDEVFKQLALDGVYSGPRSLDDLKAYVQRHLQENYKLLDRARKEGNGLEIEFVFGRLDAFKSFSALLNSIDLALSRVETKNAKS